MVVDSTWSATGTVLLGLVANGALLLGSSLIVRYGLSQPRGLTAVLATAVVFWTACTLGLETLGAFGAISVGPMLAWGGMFLGLGGVVRWLRAPAGRDRPGEETATVLSWDALISLAGVFSASLFFGMRSLLLAVKVVSDGPIYHLYFAARWWKAGRLFLVAAPFGENAATYFPANGDLWFTWLMASWGGDRLAKVGQAPFLVLAGLAAFGCARLLGAGRSASVVATCWFVSSTPLLLYSFEPNVDTIFVAGYLVAAYFFLRVSRGEGDTAALFLGALAAGQALGTKAVGVVFIPPLLALAMGGILIQSGSVRTKLSRALAIALVPLVSGGYWFIRNGLLTGNPLYPLEIRWWGHTVWHGWYGPQAMRFSHYYLPLGDWRALGDTLSAVLDPRLVPLWIGSLVGPWAIKSPRTTETRRWIAIFSLMAVLNVVIFWVCIPYRTQQRFMLQALGLAVVPLAMTLDRGPWLRHLAALLLGIHLVTPQNWPFRRDAIPWDLTPLIPNDIGAPLFPADGSARSALSVGLLFGIGLAAVLMVWVWSRISSESTRPRHRAFSALALAFFLLLGYLEVWSGALDPRIEFYPFFRDFFIGWHNLDARSGPAGSRVAYAGTDLPYYLLGNGLRNEVRYVNIDRHRDWLLHDYHREARERGQGNWPDSRPGWDRIRPDFQAWVDNLDAEGIQLLVVTRANPVEGIHNIADSENFPIERRWADSHPERFEPLYGAAERDRWFRLYRFRRSR
ncbi:MAG: 4-amino-4-deoxy-L-arabinose transferase [Isosphaerales bacterium]